MLKQSLAERVVEILREKISHGYWQEWLPQERSLAQTLGVSRNTLRIALQRLATDGEVVPIRGQGYQLTGAPAKSTDGVEKSRTVVVLSPEPLAWLRPVIGVMINELRVFLFDAGLQMEVHHGKHYYQPNAASLLDKLVAQHPAICWILLRANENTQRWFAEKQIPCLVSGTTFPGVKLPSVDVDQKAVAAHAVGQFLAMGHQRLLLIVEGSVVGSAGTVECEQGFIAAVKKNSGATGAVIHHTGNVEELQQMLVRVMNKKPRPTGVLVASSHFYLTISGVLHQMGLRVPQDVSLICTDSDHFLPFLVPQPSRYEFSHETFAHKLAQRVGKLVNSEPVKEQKLKLFPNFERGGSLSAPPRDAP